MTSAVDLIPGDPDELDLLRRKLAVFAEGMSGAAVRLPGIDSGDWKGDGGDAFRGLIGDQPPKFDSAGTAFGRAAVAVGRYVRVLRDAQADAARAAAMQASGAQATTAWQARPDVQRRAEPDPGAVDTTAATRLLADARQRVEAAARRLHAEVYDAAAGAPKRPGLLHRALHGIESGLTFVQHVKEGFALGVWEMGTGLWALTGAAITDPQTFARSWTGLCTLADIYDPAAMGAAWIGFGKSFTDWDEWSTDPGRALGHVIANAGAVALGADGLAGDAGEAGEAGIAGKGVDAGLAGETGETATVSVNLDRALGYDPAIKKFRASEYETALRIQRERGVILYRAQDSGADWVDAQGVTYDSVGNFPGEYFDPQWSNLQEQIVFHLSKATFVPVDVSGFTVEQTCKIEQYIESLNNRRIFVVGK